ncbi:MAG TPA: trehalose-6-phosphate synthase [Paracoccus sp. (in: a-proteobacteria)]|uniref:alpha,alpha-trehalose-phosphate synthase (UDP-forming) n=1 Tax=Paracoccus sp. TaxID=267 RepID=UPI002C5B40C4|nr:trehalose-6-phosphate synthase [Paracoccus sp. (in: a-proteobacteria)]HWL57036.1 trehalose-6-phosphate synthase [Paracoccus sp. (in: a-proteobacteria)]
MSRLVVVSNRLPALGKGVAAGGLAVALEAALKDKDGLWLGWSGKTSEEPGPPRLQVEGKVTYAALDLTPQDIAGYYEGISNSVLWPLCHYRPDLLEYTRADMDCYMAVNGKFADELVSMLRPDDLIWVHDYHLIPLAEALRKRGVENRIGYFHHIPWPAQDLFRALPRARSFLSAMLAYDVVGLQTRADARNLRDAVEAMRGTLEATTPPRGTRIGHYPISIDTAGFAARARRARDLPRIRDLYERFGPRDMVIGVDRLDYSKGLPERLRAIEQLLESHAGLHNRVSFLQITPASRSGIEGYDRIQQEVAERAGRLNASYGTLDWVPVRYINRAFSHSLLAGLYRLAKVGLVTPLRDGMNLVAKEYVAAQDPEDPGVLVLSQFAGAAAEMGAALIVNPYDVEDVANAMARALTMPVEERRDRHSAMMRRLEEYPVSVWARAFLHDLEPATARRAVTVASDPG